MKQLIKYICTLLVIGFCTFIHNGYSQNTFTKFSHISLDQGLSQSTINCILQDSQGYMWFGTRDGLNQFNGYEFRVFRHNPNSPSDLSNNHIHSIVEDHNGDIWIGTREGLNRYSRSLDRIEQIIHSGDRMGLPGIEINCLLIDHDNHLWIGTNRGLRILDLNKEEIQFIQAPNFSRDLLSEGNIKCLYEDSQGNLYIGSRSGGLTVYNKDFGVADSYRYDPQDSGGITGNYIRTIFEDHYNRVWVGTNGFGINQFLPEQKTFVNHRNAGGIYSYLKNMFVRTMVEDVDQRLWFGTSDGIIIAEDVHGEIHHLKNDPYNPYSLSNNSIRSFCRDWDDNIWIGSYYGGINQYSQHLQVFQHIQYHPGYNQMLNYPVISSITEDDHGRLWIGTEGGGVNIYDQDVGAFEYIRALTKPDIIPSDHIKSLCKLSSGNILIGTNMNGICLLNPTTGKATFYQHQADDSSSLTGNSIYSLLEGCDGKIWIGTNRTGLNIFDPRQKVFYTVPKIMGINVYAIQAFRDSLLLVGTNLGLNILHPVNDSLYDFISNEDPQLPVKTILAIHVDDKDVIWLGTEGGGIVRYRYDLDSLKNYNSNDGLSNNVVYSILSDHSGMVWISTNNGLSRFDPDREQFVNFDILDGIQSNEFNSGASYKDGSGRLYFGGINGITFFDPIEVKSDLHVPEVLLTNLRVNNKSVIIGDKGSPLSRHISQIDSLVLPFRLRNVTFEFSTLNFNASTKSRYMYRMVGLFDEWTENSPQRSATFTNLSPGSYTLQLRSSSYQHDEYSGVKSLYIRVLPPIWKTWYAYCVYIIIVLLSLFLFRRNALAWARLRHRLEVEQLEKEQIKAINEFKLRFFTNISHEFKTPLTLIRSSIEKIRSTIGKNYTLNRQFRILETHSERLLKLITSLTEFRKAEAGKLELNVNKYNIVYFSRLIFDAFQDHARMKKISYIFNTEIALLMVYMDPSKYETILYNLLSNAFKFTGEWGEIELRIDKKSLEDRVSITVTDTGVGIPTNKLNTVFDRFSTDESFLEGSAQPSKAGGSGIGLALTKRLILSHRGDISVASSPGSGSTFSFYLPLGSDHFTVEQLREDTPGESISIKHLKERIQIEMELFTIADERGFVLEQEYHLLIVEDDEALLNYMAEELSAGFKISKARNGKEALHILMESAPDLVVSDLYMPLMDGMELCKQIKSDINTSHIPVILLTAESSVDKQLEGLHMGADLYLPKPFSASILSVQIFNMLKGQEKLKAKYSHIEMLPSELQSTNRPTRLFLERIISEAEQGLEEKGFNIELLAKRSGLSRSAFYRRLKEATGKSPQEFLMSVKIRRASVLLRESELSIAEIAYKAGFSNAKHFSASFKKEIGVSPTEFSGR